MAAGKPTIRPERTLLPIKLCILPGSTTSSEAQVDQVHFQDRIQHWPTATGLRDEECSSVATGSLSAGGAAATQHTHTHPLHRWLAGTQGLLRVRGMTGLASVESNPVEAPKGCVRGALLHEPLSR